MDKKEISIEERIQGELTQPILGPMNKIKRTTKKISSVVWQIFHYPIGQKMNWITLLAIIGIIGSAVFVFTMLKYKTKDDFLSSDKYSIATQIEELRKSNQYFYKMVSPLEKRVKWMTLFSGWRYKLNGDFKYKEADCVGAVSLYYQQWGSKFVIESVQWLIKRIKNLDEQGLVVIRKRLCDMQAGDLVVLKYSDTNLHVGILLDTPNGKIRYGSMNVGTMTEGEDLIRPEDPAIVYIVECGPHLWCGDLLRELK